jgi:hypothetical protein
VERAPVDRVDLDVVDEDRLRALAVDPEVDEGVRPNVLPEDLELVRVDRDVRRPDPVTVDDGRKLACPAEVGDALAGDLAMFGGKTRAGGGHGRDLDRDGFRMVEGRRPALDGSFGASWRPAKRP